MANTPYYTKAETDAIEANLRKQYSYGSVEYRGFLEIADTPTLDGWYWAVEVGTYTNAGGLVTEVGKINMINKSSSTYELYSIEPPFTVENTIIEDSTNAVSGGAVFDGLALKAPINNPTFTGTVGGITKTMVGLANVDNTSDLNKPVSTAQQTALDLKASLIVGKNLFNKDSELKTFVVDEQSQFDTFGDKILRSCLTVGFDFASWQLKYSATISLSPPVYLTAEIPNAKSNQPGDGNNRILYFNTDNRIIKSESATTLATYYVEPTNGTFSYVRFSYATVNEATLQIELGSTSTGFEPYKLSIDENDLPLPTGVISSSEDKAVKGSLIYDALDTKLDKVYGKNLFNKNTTAKTFVVAEESATDTFGDQRLVNCLTTGFNFATWKLAYTALGLTLSPPIYITEEIPNAVLNQIATTSNRVIYFNADNRIIKIEAVDTLATWYDELTNGDVSYVRFSYNNGQEDIIQIEYGTTPTAYEDFTDNDEVYQIQKAVYEDDVDVVLPSKLYFVKDFNHHIYHENIVRKEINDAANVRFNLGTNFSRLTRFNFATAVTAQPLVATTSYNLRKSGVKNLTYDVINKTVNSGKTLDVLFIGDSFTDIGWYHKRLETLLTTDSITVNKFGTGGRSEVGKSESLSGGTLANVFLNDTLGVARIVDATPTVMPQTGFQNLSGVAQLSTVYTDDNGNDWLIMGGANGKMRVTKVGAVSGDFATFPTSGNLTKKAGQSSREGDAVIAYTNPIPAYFNPFLNHSTGVLDLPNYISFYGFSNPDIIVLKFFYNDLPAWATDAQVESVVNNYIEAIDHIHTSFASCKVIISIEPYGSVNGGTDIYGKKDAMLKFTTKLIETFEHVDYSDFVYLAPSYGAVDTLYGYVDLSLASLTVTPNARYTNATLINGGDGVHPAKEGGMYDISDVLYGITHKILV